MRVKSLNFLPSSTNFSRMSPYQVDNLAEEQQDTKLDSELFILSMLHYLNTDKERLIFLFELLRELGYQFDYGSAAHSLHINLRWFMRVKCKMKKLLRDHFGSHI